MLKNRIVYICLLAMTIILGIYRDGYVSTMLFYTTLTLPLVSLILVFVTKATFQLLETVDQRVVVKGDTVTYTYKIYNGMAILCCPMTLVFTDSQILFKGSILEDTDEFILYPTQIKESVKKVGCNYRGSYYIGIDKIIIRDFFNLFSISYINKEKQKINVYPLIRELKEERRQNSVVEGRESIVSNNKVNPSVFSDIREYMPGDAMKQIHWKLSAKGRELLTKSYEGSINSESQILVNLDALPFSFQENIVVEDYVIEGAVAVVNYLLMNNTPISMAYYQYEQRKITGEKHSDFNVFYKALGEMNFSNHRFTSILKEAFIQKEEACEMLIFTPIVTKEISQLIMERKPRNLKLSLFIVDVNKMDFNKDIGDINNKDIYQLRANHIPVYKISFEKGLCRLEVA